MGKYTDEELKDMAVKVINSRRREISFDYSWLVSMVASRTGLTFHEVEDRIKELADNE